MADDGDKTSGAGTRCADAQKDPGGSRRPVDWFEHMAETLDPDEGDRWGFRWRGSQKHRYNQYVKIIKPLLSAAPRRILDIGCSNGDFTARMKKLHEQHEAVGMDISQNAVEAAAQTHPDIQFRIGALPDTGLPDESFSFVSALEVIYYLKPVQRERSFAEISRILSPGGLFLFSGKLGAGEEYFSEEEITGYLRPYFDVLEERRRYGCLSGCHERFWMRQYTRCKVLLGILDDPTSAKDSTGRLAAMGRGLSWGPARFFARPVVQVGRFAARQVLSSIWIYRMVYTLTRCLAPAWGADQIHLLAKKL